MFKFTYLLKNLFILAAALQLFLVERRDKLLGFCKSCSQIHFLYFRRLLGLANRSSDLTPPF